MILKVISNIKKQSFLANNQNLLESSGALTIFGLFLLILYFNILASMLVW